ncbi:MAG: PTS sugar transporter subunit IIA [Acidobacteria bacterium]|nr:PTS sugar transporter subunit IIA [Acidobacteriota bacterium]
MSILAEATSPDLLFPELESRDVKGALEELAGKVARALPELSAEELARGFVAREALGSTALGGGLAVPHCKVAGIDRAYLAVAVSPQGVDFGATDGVPVRVLCAVLSPSDAPRLHLRLLAAISRWARRPESVEALLRSRDRTVWMSQLQEAQP